MHFEINRKWQNGLLHKVNGNIKLFFLNRQRNFSLSHKPKLKGFLTFENFHTFSTCNATFYYKTFRKNISHLL